MTISTVAAGTFLAAPFDQRDLTSPALLAAAGVVGLILLAVIAVAIRRTVHATRRSVDRGALSGRRVLIVVAVGAAFGVAGIGGARSFNAVSEKFDSALVPLVADGMIIACTALRLAALTRGWRIPGALATTYLFIGGTVALNVDAAHGVADAVAHALAPMAYAVLVEMLAHLLRLHMQLAQPARARLSALTWLTSPVITTRVWLHLSRTGSDDPVAARALVQQVVRMASRLNSICPSRHLWPLDSARAARTAALQTIRDGLLSAGELAALLPAAGRLTAGELLALVDSAALGLTGPSAQAESEAPAAEPVSAPPTAPVWLVAYLLGALRTAPTRHSDRTVQAAPVHHDQPSSAPAPVHAPHHTGSTREQAPAPRTTAPAGGRGARTDEDDLAELRRVSDAEHNGGPLGQREITRVLNCGFSKARRLAELAGWLDTTATRGGSGPGSDPEPTDTRGQLQLVSEPGENPADDDNPDQTTDRELETSNSQ